MSESQQELLSRRTRRLLWSLMIGACVLSLVAEVFIPGAGHGEGHDSSVFVFRHAHFEGGIDHYFGYFAGLGFLSCVVAIALAKFLGKWLKAPEDYYDDK